MTTKTPAKINRRSGKPKRQSTKGDGLIVFDSDVEREERKKICSKKRLNKGAMILRIAQNKLANSLNPDYSHPEYGYWCGNCKAYHLTRKRNSNYVVNPAEVLKNSDVALLKNWRIKGKEVN